MTPPNSKYIPFIVIAIAAGFMAVETFTEFKLNDNIIQIISYTLTPLGLGGLVNKGWDTLKAIKTPKVE